jgi:uncharacterized paraquat-inducible protein A
MKHVLPIFILSIVILAGAAWAHEEEHAIHQTTQIEKGASATTETEKPMYHCPMHPEVRQSTPGNCPKCGMKLRSDAEEEGSDNEHSTGEPQHEH